MPPIGSNAPRHLQALVNWLSGQLQAGETVDSLRERYGYRFQGRSEQEIRDAGRLAQRAARAAERIGTVFGITDTGERPTLASLSGQEAPGGGPRRVRDFLGPETIPGETVRVNVTTRRRRERPVAPGSRVPTAYRTFSVEISPDATLAEVLSAIDSTNAEYESSFIGFSEPELESVGIRFFGTD